MKNTLTALLLLASTALAGPPMVCHPYAPEERSSCPAKGLARLAEKETLLRMQLIQDLARTWEGDRMADLLETLRKEGRRFDLAFASACFAPNGRPDAAQVKALREAAEALHDDAAAWLAVARACTPLMRTGTLEAHASAFVKAWDRTLAMPEGPARNRMRKVLQADLETLEAYLLDPDLDKPAEVLLGIRGGGLNVPAGEGIRARLSGVEGVLKADVHPKAAHVRLAREPGKAPLEALNRALAGTPWTLGSAETTADRLHRLRGLAGPSLVVHEWGTFTSVAGEDGAALEWRPLSGPGDLPGFVHGLGKEDGLRYDRVCPRCSVRGCYCAACTGGGRCECGGCVKKGSATVRMETPVLYFYADREMAVSARVGFPEGRVTEWYPQAMAVKDGIDWGRFLVQPGSSPALPGDDAGGHYAAARETDAAPVRVCGSAGLVEHEKFLFYRGVGSFALPLSAALEGNRVRVRGPGPGTVLLFERRDGRAGFARAELKAGEALLERPAAGDGLEEALEALLVSEGLFPKEAKAMLATWRGSWFEDGLRLFYVLPRGETDRILPLRLEPSPESLVRVLVGRLEILTPDRERALLAEVLALGDPDYAVRARASASLQREGRFAEPLLRRVLAKTGDAEVRARIESLLEAGP